VSERYSITSLKTYKIGDGIYLFILGYNAALDSIEPIDVGVIENGRLVSIKPIELDNLNYLGYSFVDDSMQDFMRRYANGEINWLQLLSEL